MTGVFLIVLFASWLINAAEAACGNVNWESSFERAGWSKCPPTVPYINGLYRSKVPEPSVDYIDHLEQAQCCTNGNSDVECVQTNWNVSFHRNYTWNLCPSGYYLSGLYRSDGNRISNIEYAWCCKPRGANNSYNFCYKENVWGAFNWYQQQMVTCIKSDYYITGMYRSRCNYLYCIEEFNCCQLQTKGDVDECKDPLLHSCPTGFNCANTLGSYECVCNGKITNGICKHKGYERHRLNLRLNEEYTKALSNNASDEFKNISNRITNAMAKVYENNKAYDGTEIKGMTNGSIIVDMDLVFTDENKEGISELLEAVRNNSFGDFDVDPNALTKVITGVCPSDECPGNSTCKQLTTDTISCPCNDGYYFGGASCIAFIVIKVEVTLVKEFTEDLNNESSTAYQELKRNITAELFERFKDTENFENVVVLGFRNGSVIVDFEVIYRKDTSNKKIIVGQTVKEKIINGKLGKYQVKGGLVQERPPPPTRLKTTGKTENSIDISWEKPEAYSAFIIKGYEIRHKANTATQYKKRNVSVESLLNVVLTDLDSDTIYEITVHAYNKEGDGDQIKILVTTEKPEDSMTVVIVVVVVVLFVVVFVIVAMVIFFQLKKRRRRQESQLRQAAYAGRTNGDQVAMTVTSKKTNYDNFGQTAEDVSVTQKC